MIYKLVTRVIQYFCFPERPIKVGTSCISRKGGILEKGRLIQKRMGSMIPLTNYFHRPPQNFRSSPNLIFCSGPPPPNYFSLKFFVPPLKLGGGGGLLPCYCMMNYFLCLKKKCFVLMIFRFFCFSGILKFQNL